MTTDLDRKIAEMKGWTSGKCVDEDGTHLAWFMGGVFICYDSDYSPTTNISQAMELLEEFECWDMYRNVDGYICNVFNNINIRMSSSSYQPTLELAICHAWLKAKEQLNPK